MRPGHPWASNLQALLIFDTCYPIGAFVFLWQKHLAFLLHNSLFRYFVNLLLHLPEAELLLKYHSSAACLLPSLLSSPSSPTLFPKAFHTMVLPSSQASCPHLGPPGCVVAFCLSGQMAEYRNLVSAVVGESLSQDSQVLNHVQ